ncbi:MAG TPA: hypothetical protein VJ860_22855, partial [Polyangia bacterium]|nr:hypothetical protein [Polyangia bacterium]
GLGGVAGVSARAAGAATTGAEASAGARAGEREPPRRQAGRLPASNSNEKTATKRKVKTSNV